MVADHTPVRDFIQGLMQLNDDEKTMLQKQFPSPPYTTVARLRANDSWTHGLHDFYVEEIKAALG